MFGLFKNKNLEEIISPCNGELIQIEAIPDPVFSEKMMGDGMAVIPSDGKLISPVDGEVHQIFNTKHAILVKSQKDTIILIHIGLDTVSLEGVPFDVKVIEGQKIQKGDLLMDVNLQYIREKGLNTIIPVILMNEPDKGEKTIAEKSKSGIIAAGQCIMKIK